MAIFQLKSCTILLRTTLDEGPLGVHLYQNDPKSIKKWLIYGYFPNEKLRDSIENHMGQTGPFGVHLCHKDPKSIKIQLSYGYFTTERLRDSIENHIGQWTTGTLWCSFIPKGDPLVFISYQIDPKIIKNWLTYGYFPSESLHDSIANHMGQKGTL